MTTIATGRGARGSKARALVVGSFWNGSRSLPLLRLGGA